MIGAKERCVPNLNEAYSGHGGEEMDLCLINDAANVGANTDNHLDIMPPGNLFE